MAAGHHQQNHPLELAERAAPGITTGPGRSRTMPTDNNGAAAPVHPLELALLGLIAAALALRTLLALVLAVAGWRPRADAPTRPMAEQMSQLPMAEPEVYGAEQPGPVAQPPAAEPAPAPRSTAPSSSNLLAAAAAADAASLAELPIAELRAAYEIIRGDIEQAKVDRRQQAALLVHLLQEGAAIALATKNIGALVGACRELRELCNLAPKVPRQ